MELNFYEQFGEYSNIDLLKIVNRPDGYQTEAIEAASEILKGRQISDEDVRNVENFFNDKDEQLRIKKEKTESIKNQVTDFLEPIIQPGPTVEPRKWTNLFLIFLALEYLRAIFIKIRNIVLLIRFTRFTTSENQNGLQNGRADFYFFFSITLEVAYVIYIPVLFYLLYKRKRLGWMLLFADQIISLLLSMSNSYFLFKYQSLFHARTVQWLFWIFWGAAFIYFLWQDKVASYFNIPKQTKGKVVMASILLYIVFMSFLKIFFY